MKKTYIAPEVEITRFNTEDIMSESAIIDFGADDAKYDGAGANVETVKYSDLFSL